MSDWIQLHEFVEGLVDDQLEDVTDPLTRALIERDRDRIVDFVEATMLRRMGLASDGQWLQ